MIRSCIIDHLLLANDRIWWFFEAFYRSERADDLEIYPLISNALHIQYVSKKCQRFLGRVE